MLTWVVYDISDDGKRARAAKRCKVAGLVRVQKSVFLGSLPRSRREELVMELEEDMELKTDSVYVFPMCEGDFRQIVLLGLAFDKTRVSGELRRWFV